MKVSAIKILIFSAIIILFQACKKDAGPGGTSKITGKVYVKEYNYNFTEVIGEHWAQDEDVFIVYDDNTVYNDKFATSYDGTFEFKYLNKGKYTIFVYSKDTTSLYPTGDVIVSREVEITENGQTINLDDIVIANN
ncbi:MAG: hypothetical protein A2W91_16215 [Bacteroidetes bacterium GWF2_38_335]|nr:MAG: hypothetical protein A2W91_16215 [Bacteroidetes bacterium GWF2_38_335]OFY81234.1 MAG: hypothetical protein A2281_07190 [Bacteroidetes bacterium RIFOXYA12_FULL_38_20]HBS85351.1 hypothetical protein [Bacteroidales bacterium]